MCSLARTGCSSSVVSTAAETVTHAGSRFTSGGSHCVEGETPVADTTKSTPCTDPLLSSRYNGHRCSSPQASGLDTCGRQEPVRLLPQGGTLRESADAQFCQAVRYTAWRHKSQI